MSVELSNINGGNGSQPAPDKRELLCLLKLLKKYQLKSTEELLCQEANVSTSELVGISETDVQQVLGGVLGLSGGDTASKPSEAPPKSPPKPTAVTEANAAEALAKFIGDDSFDAQQYEQAYEELRSFVEDSLDIYKHELSMALYPILVQIYFKILASAQKEKARDFIEKYKSDLDGYYIEGLFNLLMISKPEELLENDLVVAMEVDKFVIRMSRDSHSLFKRHIQDRRQEVVADIVAKYLHFDTYEGMARSKIQCVATAGSHIGEAKRQDNKMRVYYGLLKEVDFQTLTTPAPAPEEEDDDPDAPDRPKKKKPKKDPLLSKKSKSDPNAPAIDRIPLPELKDSDKLLKLKALREAGKRLPLSKDQLPSAVFYTILNSQQGVTCAEISDDSTMLACGFADSSIRIWSLTPTKLRALKEAESLRDLDKESADINVRMLSNNGESTRSFFGHTGPVYRCAFAPEMNLMLSCSEDSTIRLWSLLTWSCVVTYRGHVYPVWDVRFAPHGYYFVSGSYDKTARLWATDSNQALRVFVGHLSDVDCVQFHPNSNYVATGSSDRTVRLWDNMTGQSVRLMTGHKGTVSCLAFSACGRYLASGAVDHQIIVWDLSSGSLVTTLLRHLSTVSTITFSRDGTLLAAAGLDNNLTLWDFHKVTDDYINNHITVSHHQDENDEDVYLLRTFPSKNSPFVSLHFTRRNLLMCVGLFKS
ncbi:transcription initiation factor TFIID subunit 5 [Drosophila tropicalis]|uniref:transcription initiation factor TFIID subunit 5 n=1 Tax=Drosophila tropicalis TaxID=46794 RepID=UPI0035ABE8F5